MKHSSSFYVKSSGNQQMRLSSSTLIEMQYHQINLMDSIKTTLLAFSCQSYRRAEIDLHPLFFFFLHGFLTVHPFFFSSSQTNSCAAIVLNEK